ncbi:MAG: hypothetical protein RQM92_09305 [Candidatus Syntrophopropionicum ammoniitolerans]
MPLVLLMPEQSVQQTEYMLATTPGLKGFIRATGVELSAFGPPGITGCGWASSMSFRGTGQADAPVAYAVGGAPG